MSAYTARAVALANTPLPSGVATVVNYETLSFDPWGAISVGAAWRWTAPWSGWVGVTAGLRVETGGAVQLGEYVLAAVYRRGVQVANLAYVDWVNNAPGLWLQGSDVIAVTAGDWLDVRVAHNAGATLNVYTGGARDMYNRVAFWRVD
jgi:hypothetical protein